MVEKKKTKKAAGKGKSARAAVRMPDLPPEKAGDGVVGGAGAAISCNEVGIVGLTCDLMPAGAIGCNTMPVIKGK